MLSKIAAVARKAFAPAEPPPAAQPAPGLKLIGDPPTYAARAHFFGHISPDWPKSVLEVGTLRDVPSISTKHRRYFPDPGPERYVCLDIAPGEDVDVVGDIHAMPAEWTGLFDAFIAMSVFEHLERPWIAAREIARILAPGGRFLVSTHQCYPLHGYPSDFFRFSKEALRLIFEDAGLAVDISCYENRSAIVVPETLIAEPLQQHWNNTFPSWIHVEATGRKPA
jgi:SAM-dependent methyltransferase